MKTLTIIAGALAAPTAAAPCVAQSAVVSAQAATTFVKPYDDALMAETPAGMRSSAESLTAPHWQNCTDQDVCETREAAFTR